MPCINKKCLECSKISFKGIMSYNKPECYEPSKCKRKRNYYKYHKLKKQQQIDRHRYLKYKGDKCVICGFASNLDVHHIKPQSEGGLDSKRNTITLCKRCHRVVSSYYKIVGWVR